MQVSSSSSKLEEDNLEKEGFPADVKKKVSLSLVLKRIREVTDNFGLDDSFLQSAKKNLELLWSSIKNTKVDVIVGFVCTITVTRLHKETPNCSSICSYLGISSGSLLNRIKNFLVLTLHEERFISLKKSSTVLRQRLYYYEKRTKHIRIEDLISFRTIPGPIKLNINIIKELLDWVALLLDNESFKRLSNSIVFLAEFIEYLYERDVLPSLEVGYKLKCHRIIGFLHKNNISSKHITQKKEQILNFIVKHGPVKKSQLKSQFIEGKDHALPSALAWQIIDTLVKEHSIYFEKHSRTIYFYSLKTPHLPIKQQDFTQYRYKRKFSKFSSLYKDFSEDLIAKHKKIGDHKEVLDEFLLELAHFYYKLTFTGRTSHQTFLGIGKLLLKRKLYFLLRDKTDLEILKKWLTLYEVIHQELLEAFRGIRPNPYRHYVEALLNDPEFCEKKNKKGILETPDPYVRFQFLLFYFDVKKEMAAFVIHSFETCKVAGYNPTGKGIRGIIAALYYLYYVVNKIGVFQHNVATKFGVTGTTLRVRLGEFNKYLIKQSDYYKNYPNPICSYERQKEMEKFIKRGGEDLLKLLPFIFQKKKNLVTTATVKKQRVKLSVSSGLQIVKRFGEIIDELVSEYGVEFYIRKFIEFDFDKMIQDRINTLKGNRKVLSYSRLDNDTTLRKLKEKAKKQKALLTRIEQVGEDHKYLLSTPLMDLFKLILHLRDFVMGGSLAYICKKCQINKAYVDKLITIMYPGDFLFKFQRFYYNGYFHEIKYSLADTIARSTIDHSSFKNILNAQLQQLFAHYRLQKSLKSSLFPRMHINTDFMEWLDQLPDATLSSSLSTFEKVKSKKDFFIMCAEINRNWEIPRFLLYALIKTQLSPERIAQIIGKSIKFVKEIEKDIWRRRVYFKPEV